MLECYEMLYMVSDLDMFRKLKDYIKMDYKETESDCRNDPVVQARVQCWFLVYG